MSHTLGKIVRLAGLAFRPSPVACGLSSHPPATPASFQVQPQSEAVLEIQELANRLTLRDLGHDSACTVPRRKLAHCVSYQPIYESPLVHLGLYTIPQLAEIPLRDHSAMVLLQRLMRGRLQLETFDWARPPVVKTDDQNREYQEGWLVPKLNSILLGEPDLAATASFSSDFTPPSEFFASSFAAAHVATTPDLCRHFPQLGNLHRLTALDDCLVLDISLPPYSRDEGRFCRYFRESRPDPQSPSSVPDTSDPVSASASGTSEALVFVREMDEMGDFHVVSAQYAGERPVHVEEQQ